jgi:branched-chain amino acid transport system ATP-binding protein
MALLELTGVRIHYGGIEAVKGIALSVDEGEIVTMIGANGAGKTTTLKTISGLKRPTSGTIVFRGQRIDVLPAHRIVTLGIGQSPEGRRIFGRMSVRENLEMGLYAAPDRKETKRRAHESTERVYSLFPVLKERSTQAGGTLSGGEQQMLAIGRALMTQPDLLLLDEPSLGLAPLMVEKIFDIVREINGQGTTVLLVEQNAHMALQVANRGYVLESGEIVLHDDADRLLGNEQVRKSYLGEE